MKRILCACLLAVCLLTFSAVRPVSAKAAGNYKDWIVECDALDTGGGTCWRTPWRSKLDNTKAYVKNTYDSGGAILCWVERSRSSFDQSADCVDRYYGHGSYNGATQNAKMVYRGWYYYLTNYVYEDHYSYAAIGFIPWTENVYYKFYWSPDSI